MNRGEDDEIWDIDAIERRAGIESRRRIGVDEKMRRWRWNGI